MKPCFSLIVLIILLAGTSFSAAEQDTLKLPPGSSTLITAINFKDTDVRDVLRSIAYEYEVNIVVDNQLSQKVTVSLFNVKVYDALKIIAQDYGLSFQYDNTRFYVKKIPEKEKPVPAEAEPEITITNNLLTIKLQNVEITKFINALAKVTQKNFLIAQGTTGRVSGDLANVELNIALKNILFNNGYFYQIKDSIYYVTRSAYFSVTDKNPKDASQPYWVNAMGGRITIDVNQASLEKILNDISAQLGLQIVKLVSPTANVTLKCNDVSLEKALYYLFRGTDFAYKDDNGVIIVGNKTTKLMDNTRLIKFSYLRADKMKDKIPSSISQGLVIQVITEHNAFAVNGASEAIIGLLDYIKAIDQPVPQVLIEAMVVDYNLDNLLQYGLTAGTVDSTYSTSRPDKWYPGLDVTAGGKTINRMLEGLGTINAFNTEINIGKLAKLPEGFYANIKALEEHGIANVKSKPLLSTLNGYTASLKIGTVQNYIFKDIMPVTNVAGSSYMLEKENIQKIEATISFEITPWVGPNSELTLEIKPDFQTPVGTFSPDKGKIPSINTRSMSSTVRLKDGETIILGGLIQESESDTKAGLPLISKIPWLGDLFASTDKKKTKAELIIYLTPHISYGDDYETKFNINGRE